MSIRIPSGQSFHWEAPSEGERLTVELSLEGPIVVPYPREMAGQVELSDLLATHGIAMGEGWRGVSIESEGSVWYAARVSEECAEAIEQCRKAGADVRLTTPLAKVVVSAVATGRHRKNIYLHLSEGVLYAAYAERHHLRYAEALPCSSEAELLQVVALLNKDFGLTRGEFNLMGEATAFRKSLRSYFRRVRMIENW